jgi:hypothetical protein
MFVGNQNFTGSWDCNFVGNLQKQEKKATGIIFL